MKTKHPPVRVGVMNIKRNHYTPKPHISKTLEYSLVAFNGSSNCDNNSPERFYNSYIGRKESIISSKLCAISNGCPINRDKLKKEIEYLKSAKNDKSLALQFLSDFLGMIVNNEDDSIIEEAHRVLEQTD